MILIVNTLENDSHLEALKNMLEEKNLDFEIADTAGKKISHCIGCNYCWLKTPGICTIKDDYEEILKKIIKADEFWVVADTSFGFISHQGKNIFDRIMPLVTMYLHFKDGQMRHVMRYKKKADVGIIYRGDGNKEYLGKWCARVAINLGSRSLGAYSLDQLKEAVECM